MKKATATKPKSSQTQLTYDAAESRNRRRCNVTNLKSEDRVLKPRDRDKVISQARILRRNASVVRWAVNKHCDYVSTFNFQCRTGNDQLDEKVEQLFEWWSKPENCDSAGRHSLQGLIRLGEGLRTTDGDVFYMTLSTGQLQLIEGDRVRTPTALGEGWNPGDIDTAKFLHGVETTKSGRAIRYAVCDRTAGGRFELASIIPAKYVHQHGYFDRYDQIRGISPLASAINSFCDIYESTEYALARSKLSQLFLLKFRRGAPDSQVATEKTPYDFDFGAGPQAVELDPDDDAEFMESAQPSTQFQSFMQQGIQLGLKALDIPYSYYNESFTNYSGSRQAMLIYEQSANVKRQDVKRLLCNLTRWRLSLFIEDGELVLPDGWTVEDITFDFIHTGLAWIDPQKEASADEKMILNGLRSRQEISKARGRDWFEIAEQIAAENAYLKELGIAPVVTKGNDDSFDEQG